MLPPDQWCLTIVMESPEDACPRAEAVRALCLGGIDVERHAADVTRCFAELVKANNSFLLLLQSVDPNFDHIPGVHQKMMKVIESMDDTAIPYPMRTFQKLFSQLPSSIHSYRYTKTEFYVIWRHESRTTTVKWKPMFSDVQVETRKPLVALYIHITKVVLLLVEVAQLNYKIGRFYTGLGFAWTALIFSTNLLKKHSDKFDPFLMLQHAVSFVVLTALTVLMTEAHSDCCCHQQVSIVTRSCLRMFESCLCLVDYDSIELEISCPSLGEIYHSLIANENSYNEANGLTARQMAVCAIFCEMRLNNLMQYLLEDGKDDEEADREFKACTTDRRDLALRAVLAVHDPYMRAAIHYMLSCNLYIETSFLTDFFELQRLETFAVSGLEACLRYAKPFKTRNKEFAELFSLATVVLQTNALRNCVRFFHTHTDEEKLHVLDCFHSESQATSSWGEQSEHTKNIVFLVTFIHIYFSDHILDLMNKANIQDRRLLKRGLDRASKQATLLLKFHPHCHAFCRQFLFDVVQSWKTSDTMQTKMAKTLALFRGFTLLARLSERACDVEDSEDDEAKDGEGEEGKDVGGDDGKGGEGKEGKYRESGNRSDGEGQEGRDGEGQEGRDGEGQEGRDGEGKEECEGEGKEECTRESLELSDIECLVGSDEDLEGSDEVVEGNFRDGGDGIDGGGEEGMETSAAVRLQGGDGRDEAEDSKNDGKYGKDTINKIKLEVESSWKIKELNPLVYVESRYDSSTPVNSEFSEFNATKVGKNAGCLTAGKMVFGIRNLYGPGKNTLTVKNLTIKTAKAENEAADQMAFVAKWVAEQNVLEMDEVRTVSEEIGTKKEQAENKITAKRVKELKAAATEASAANFSAANFSAANFSAANLASGNLAAGNLAAAILSATNISVAIISAAYFSDANFSVVNFSATNLSATNLSATNLSATNLSATNLSATNLSATNLSATNLSATNLSATKLSLAKSVEKKAATDQQMEAATDQQMEAATDQQMEAATDQQMEAATDQQMEAATDQQMEAATDQQTEAATDQQMEAANTLSSNSCPEDYNYFCEYHFDVHYLPQTHDMASPCYHLFDVARSLDNIAERLSKVKYFRGKSSWPSTKTKAEACLKDLLQNETTVPDTQRRWAQYSSSDLYDGHRKLGNSDNLKIALKILQDHRGDGPELLDCMIQVSEVLGLQTTWNSS